MSHRPLRRPYVRPQELFIYHTPNWYSVPRGFPVRQDIGKLTFNFDFDSAKAVPIMDTTDGKIGLIGKLAFLDDRKEKLIKQSGSQHVARCSLHKAGRDKRVCRPNLLEVRTKFRAIIGNYDNDRNCSCTTTMLSHLNGAMSRIGQLKFLSCRSSRSALESLLHIFTQYIWRSLSVRLNIRALYALQREVVQIIGYVHSFV